MNLKRATSVAFFVLTALVLGHAGIGLAQEAVYRCGLVITNDAAQAKQEKCQLLEGGTVVTIPSPRKAVAVTQNPKTSLNKASPLTPRQATAQSLDQSARDADAKAIIESELKKTQAQLVDWRKQYAALSTEQDLEKKLALKQQIARGEADVESLKREIKR